MRFFKLCQPLCLLVELILHLMKGVAVVGHAHRHVRALTHINAAHKELFHGKTLRQACVNHFICVAKTTRSDVAFHTVLSIFQQRT